MKTKNAKRTLKNQKFRTGSASLLVTLCVIAGVVVLNVLFTNLEKAHSWTRDMSFNSVTSQSDTTNQIIDELQTDVNIYLFSSKGSEDISLATLLTRYDARSQHITLTEANLLLNPLMVQAFYDDLDGQTVTNDCVVINCPATGRSRILTSDDYTTSGYDSAGGVFVTTGIQYEHALSQALVYVTQEDVQTIQILQGHGELDEEEAAQLTSTLQSAGYRVAFVNLISGDTLDAKSLLMILSPVHDITNEELTALTAFSAAGGNLFITSDYLDTLNLPNYYAYLRSYGIVPYSGVVVADATETGTYYSDYTTALLPDMLSTDATVDMVYAGNDTLLLLGARAFDTSDVLDKDVERLTVLRSGSKSYLRDYSDGADTLDKKTTDKDGPFALALLCNWAQPDTTRSRAFVIGNSTCFTTSWVMQSTYSGEFLLQMVQYLQGKETITVDIPAKNAARESLTLNDMTPAVFMIVLLPLLLALVGMIILLPRKNL